MKKLLIVLTTAIMLFSAALFVSCGGDTESPAGGETSESITSESNSGGQHVHFGGVATCTKKAVCDECGEEYGEINAANHPEAKLVYTTNGDGTHKKVCEDCKATVTASENCSGGIAYCDEKAICDYCKAEYGETGEHYGGIATCIEKAICSGCGKEYGETNPDRHASNEVSKATDNGDGTHSKKYKCCGAEVGNESHKGGEATCQNLAKCEVCGAEYGKLGNHSYTVAKNNGENHWYACEYCGEINEETLVKHSIAEWETVEDGRIAKCECGFEIIVEKVATKDAEIYTMAEFNGETYKNELAFTPAVKENGKDVTTTVTVENEDIAVYENGVIRGIKAGETVVTVSYTLLGENVEKSFNVTVIRPVAEYAETVPFFSAMDGTHEIFETLFGSDEITDAAQIYNGENVALTVTDGKLDGIKTSSKTFTSCELDVYTATYGYKLLNVKAYTKVISASSDFEALKLTADRKTIEGYFIMKNDVVFNKYDFDGNGNVNYYDNIHPYYDKDSKKVTDGFTVDLTDKAGTPQKTGGFIGTFDGNGFNIIGYRAGNSYGLFGTISGTTSDYTIVKNVGFVDTLAEAANWTYGRLFAEHATCVMIDNVYISFANNAASKYSNWTKNLSLFGCVESVYFRFNNVIIDYGSTSETAATGKEQECVGFFKTVGATNYWGMIKPENQWHGQMKTVYRNVYAIAPKAANGRVMPLNQSTTVSVYAINDITEIPADGTAVSLDGTNKNPVVNASGSMKIFHWVNAYRYDTYADMIAAGKNNIGKWEVSSSGVKWNWNLK